MEIADKDNIKRESLNATFQYLINAKKDDEVELFFAKILSSKLHKYEDDIMTYAETLIQRGRQQGRLEGERIAEEKIKTSAKTLIQKGEHEAQQKIIANMLDAGFNAQEIAKITGLSLNVIKNLV